MSGVGLKVSRVGFDVDTASDKQLSFSSEWPLLPIEAEGDFTIPASGGSGVVDVFTHNLGYVPIFTMQNVTAGPGAPLLWPNSCLASDEKIYYDGPLDTAIDIKWKVYRRPMLQNVEYDKSDVGDATPGLDNDYGLLVSLPGKDILSTDKRDFSIRSDVRQLMIAQSNYTSDFQDSWEITHNLGYKPMYLFYVEDDGVTPGDYFLYSAAADLNIFIDNTTIDIDSDTTDYNGGGMAILIFKDTIDTDG